MYFDKQVKELGIKFKFLDMWVSSVSSELDKITFSKKESEATIISTVIDGELIRNILTKFPYARAIVITEIMEDKTEDILRFNKLL